MKNPIVAWREEKRISRQVLASTLEVSPITVAKWEKGVGVTTKTLQKLRALGVDVEAVVAWEAPRIRRVYLDGIEDALEVIADALASASNHIPPTMREGARNGMLLLRQRLLTDAQHCASEGWLDGST